RPNSELGIFQKARSLLRGHGRRGSSMRPRLSVGRAIDRRREAGFLARSLALPEKIRTPARRERTSTRAFSAPRQEAVDARRARLLPQLFAPHPFDSSQR